MTFAEVIKSYRELRGMTAKQLADAAGVNASDISRYETSGYRPTDGKLSKIEEALGLKKGQILVEVGLVELEPRHSLSTPSADLMSWARSLQDDARTTRAQVDALLDQHVARLEEFVAATESAE